MTSANTCSGWLPRTARPLTKNVGVPGTPSRRASATSAAIDATAEREQPVVHRPEPALGVGGERGLGAERLVLVERQRAVDPAQLAGVQAREVIERGLHAVAVLA